MSDAESRSLRRAALALLMVSALRWGGEALRSARSATPDEASVLPELAEATDVASLERERRDRPLAEGERIDPNRADEVELDRLPGVGPSTARAIVTARDSMIFRTPGDLAAARGVGPALVSRIGPHLDLGAPPAARSRRTWAGAGQGAGGWRSAGPRAAPGTTPLVDLNRADPASLEGLPGIGPALAARIVDARTARPFSTVDDLIRVPGIGPATLERLRPLVMVSPGR